MLKTIALKLWRVHVSVGDGTAQCTHLFLKVWNVLFRALRQQPQLESES